MALDSHHPVQNSEVYLLNAPPHAPASAPPSPPTPAVFCDRELSPPMDELMSLTPPESQDSCQTIQQRLARAVHVLSTEATALSCLTRLYETDPIAKEGFNAAVEAISRFRGDKGKLVLCGVGKSGHIAKKLVATMNSLKIHATYLHPTEALHGDLGKVGKYDTILLITFSGKTPELLSLLPHFDAALPLIVMTSHTHPSTCELLRQRPDAILLPAPIHESETLSFGVSAPTTSTTMALALGDALAMVISEELHPSVAAVFSQNHPGGAIGAAFKGPVKMSELSVSVVEIPDLAGPSTGAQILMSAYRSDSGWVRKGQAVVMPPRRIKKMQPGDMDEDARCIRDLMVSRADWLILPADMDITAATQIIRSMRLETPILDDTIIALTEDDEIGGFLEVADIMN